MPRIPITIGNLTAFIEKPGKAGCSVPGCKGEHTKTCVYGVGVPGKLLSHCGAHLCDKHGTTGPGGNVTRCPPHARLTEKARMYP
jgi:hypothetical protein